MSAGRARSLPETVRVGRIRRPHGVRGEVGVEVTSDVADRMSVGDELLVRRPDGVTRRLVVASARPHKDLLLVRFEGLDQREQVDELRSQWLEIEREKVPPAPQDAYYYYELVGCVCRGVDGSDLGEVAECIEDGGGLLLEIDKDGKRLLVPFVRAYVRRVDVAAGEIELDLPAGMIETCTST